MDRLLAGLGSEHVAIDLGCGQGSFNYSAYTCRVVGIDLTLNHAGLYFDNSRIAYLEAHSNAVPLLDASANIVVCHHSLEHFSKVEETLEEIARVLKPGGLLWLSVPNGYGCDDRLYRWLYAGGGHVNRFSFEDVKERVEKATGLFLRQSCILTSGFTYWRRPPPAIWPYLPRRVRAFHVMPAAVSNAIGAILNTLSRAADKMLHTHLSSYGWGFVFGPKDATVGPLPSYFNVCSHCGVGASLERLLPNTYRRLGLVLYRCLLCRHRNVLFKPAPGFE